MFSESCDLTYRQVLKDNYIYQLWVNQKWFHQGPMRMFPLVIDMSKWPDIHMPDVEVPWLDEWDEQLVVPSLYSMGIAIQGKPFIPRKDMDIVLGIVGDYVRSVQ